MTSKMRNISTSSDAKGSFRSLIRERNGSAVLYVTIAMAALFGMAALAIDAGRLMTTSTHAKQASDGAAIAAASQLDGNGDSITRATNAAQTTPLVQNVQTLGATPGNISIVDIRFLNGLPAGDPSVPNDRSELDSFVTTDPLQARFAEVTTEQVVQNNMFIRALGFGPTSTTHATSVAGFTQTICRRAPFVICNPDEQRVGTGAPFDGTWWQNKQFHIKASGPSSSWTPGDFGLADVEGYQSAPEIADMLADDEPDLCISAMIDVKPGQTQSTRTGINVRFDMYENPFFGSPADMGNSNYRPARNVVKGKIRNPADTGAACTYIDAPPGTAMGLPHDSNLDGTNRFGNGQWNCETYWNMNHPVSHIRPAGCVNAGSSPPGGVSRMSRHQIYRHEIDNNLIPDAGPPSPEDGRPSCGYGNPTPNESPDRREIVFAVINCVEHGPITGNSAGPIPVEAFVKSFITEPVAPGPNFDTYLEVIDTLKPGADDGILHDMVQLYR